MKIHNRVLREGTGTPLILVNAFPVDGRMWEDCADQVVAQAESMGVAPHFPIWAPDMPGSGLSPVPSDEESGPRADDGSYPEALNRMVEAYVALMKSAGYDQAIWVGLSMGGYLVSDLWRLHPEAVAGIGLFDTMACSDGVGGAARLKVSDALEATGSLEPVMHFAQPADGDSTVKRSQAFIDRMTMWIMEQSPAGCAWRQRMTFGRPDLSAVPASIDVPAAVVSGTLDPSSNPAVLHPLAERIGDNASFTAIDDCGHFSAVEHPDIVARALLDLVRRVEQTR